MCRIAGMISVQLNSHEIYEKVKIMCDALQNGGPDDEGIFEEKNIHLAFGHRRLSIIDLSNKGHQPMADINQKACITFNGEIYNYLELRDQLKSAGAEFYSRTDTEVILQAYLHWGVAAFAKLRGMFAFALYDSTNALTYLVRDTSGIKPLYYHIDNGQLSFASEIRALKKAQITTEADKNWQVRFLAYGHIPEPYTKLNNVFNLPKGNLLCWNHQDNTYQISPYNQAPSINYITDKRVAQQQVHDSLKAAINRQLIADAPIGVFLSGGIDSSLIALLSHQQRQQLKTVSIFFNDKDYDERSYQKLVLDKIQGDKFTHLVKYQDFEANLPHIINAMDMPTTDGINTWFISRYAQQDGLKAVLSGIGADELFGGYPSFNRIKYIQYLRKFPALLLRTANHFSDRYKKVAYLAKSHPLADYLFLRGLFAPADIAKILDCDEKQVYDTLFFANYSTVQPIKYNEEQAAYFETDLYMQNQLLRDTDVMSMSNGLEVRVPFLDEDFRQIANSISPEIRFDKNQPKKLLVDSFNGLLPDAVWNRPKMGFSFPLQRWMKQHKEIANESSYKRKEAQNIIKAFKNDKAHWSKAFALYQLEQHA